MSDWKRIKEMPELNDMERLVIEEAATEPPRSGKYDKFFENGVYLCRRCGQDLYLSEDKFDCGCGWPAFDAAIPGAVAEKPDPDGRRTEILCSNCKGHLGHVFRGEKFTLANTRHCVNSASIHFAPAKSAIFAGGCFWGVEHFFAECEGILLALSGYIGGDTEMPTYQDVCSGATGHAEAVIIKYDPQKTNYRELVRSFFEIHDPTQLNRQGPDHGSQYRSAIFYNDEAEREIAEETIEYLKSKGINVVTRLVRAGRFYAAEEYHQDYFDKNPHRLAYTCHVHKKIDWKM